MAARRERGRHGAGELKRVRAEATEKLQRLERLRAAHESRLIKQERQLRAHGEALEEAERLVQGWEALQDAARHHHDHVRLLLALGAHAAALRRRLAEVRESDAVP